MLNWWRGGYKLDPDMPGRTYWDISMNEQSPYRFWDLRPPSLG